MEQTAFTLEEARAKIGKTVRLHVDLTESEGPAAGTTGKIVNAGMIRVLPEGSEIRAVFVTIQGSNG